MPKSNLQVQLLQSALKKLSSDQIRAVFEKQGVYNSTVYPYVSFIPNTISITDKGSELVITVSAKIQGEKNHSKNKIEIDPRFIKGMLEAIKDLKTPQKPVIGQYDVVPTPPTTSSATPPAVPARPAGNTPVKRITPLTAPETQPSTTHYADAAPLETANPYGFVSNVKPASQYDAPDSAFEKPPIIYEKYLPTNGPAAPAPTSPSASKPGSNPQYNSVLRANPSAAAQATGPSAGAPPIARQDVRVRAPLPGAQFHQRLPSQPSTSTSAATSTPVQSHAPTSTSATTAASSAPQQPQRSHIGKLPEPPSSATATASSAPQQHQRSHIGKLPKGPG